MLTGAALPLCGGHLLGGAQESSAIGSKQMRAEKQAGDTDDKNDSKNNKGNNVDNDNENYNDVAGARSLCCTTKTIACS